MVTKSEVIDIAMEHINEMILSLGEKSLDRMRLSNKVRLAITNNVDTLLALEKDGFKKAVEQIFREELMNELVRTQKNKE